MGALYFTTALFVLNDPGVFNHLGCSYPLVNRHIYHFLEQIFAFIGDVINFFESTVLYFVKNFGLTGAIEGYTA